MESILRLHRDLIRYDARITDWAGSLLSLAIRLFVGWQFFKAGMVKLSDWDATLALFQVEYHVPLLPPAVAAWLGASGELVFPVLLALGLLTRPAALGLFVVNAMAVLSYPALFAFECPAAINDHFYWGALLLVLVGFGAGRISLDDWLSRK
ncbi:DoxX family protein [Noviherbaspirillum sp.]|uniref:DoxX family protein n=1 Tax=Noviherbaspirillum sp. TaxID=1926288 RepID=UPI002B4751C3|nr:DoxX family protein [Noviherbaspirillum sp.]HJV82951.1 DoxX family protein [Noviherbaspirillum sp.]